MEAETMGFSWPQIRQSERPRPGPLPGKEALEARILVAEHHEKSAAYVSTALGRCGFAVDLADNGADALCRATTGEYDMIIVNVMLPHGDGWSFAARLRSAGMRTPVLFLTVSDDVSDRAKALELGVEDYIVRPFTVLELRARVRSLLRRAKASPGAQR
jgi:two-component system copper resistance phosphate regulon response regulator CusR